MTDLRIFSRPKALELLGLSPRTWARLEAKGETPPKIRLSAGRIGYAVSDLQKWIAARREAEPSEVTIRKDRDEWDERYGK